MPCGRHLQANLGQCRNGDDEPHGISFADIITAHKVLKECTELFLELVTIYSRYLQPNVGQCRNGDDEPQGISFAVIIKAH